MCEVRGNNVRVCFVLFKSFEGTHLSYSKKDKKEKKDTTSAIMASKSRCGFV